MPTYGPENLHYPNTSDAPDVPGAFLTLLQDIVVGGAKPFTTQALLTASGTGYAGQLAVVTSDSTAALNGVYQSNGSAWSPVWLNISASVKRSATSATFSQNVWTPLTNTLYWTADQPAAGMSAFNGTFVVPIDGVYDIRVGVQLDTTVNAILCLKRNDSGASSSGNIASTTNVGVGNFTALSLAKRKRLSAGDYVCAALFNPTGASATWNTASPDASYFDIRYVEPLR